jgi:predicted nucleotidyltransferase
MASDRPSDVDDVLRVFSQLARGVLEERFVGMYLYGSLATGDFDPDRSDIDFVVVADGELTPVQIAALTKAHDRFAESGSPWAIEVDGSYIPREALRRYDSSRARHLHVERGVGKLRMEHFGPDWVIQRQVLREHGVALAGPPPATLIDPVHPDEIFEAVRAVALDAWAPLGEDLASLSHWGGQVFAILTMCRLLHTLETGDLASKQAAGRWARQVLGEPSASLIDRALAWKKSDPRATSPQDAAATRALIRLVVERWRAAP